MYFLFLNAHTHTHPRRQAELEERGGIIHSEVSAKNLHKVVHPTISVLGDVGDSLRKLQPLLEKNLDHSSPDIREASVNAKAKLLEGAGDLVDPAKRFKALYTVLTDGLKPLVSGIKKEVIHYLGDTCSAMLEEIDAALGKLRR